MKRLDSPERGVCIKEMKIAILLPNFSRFSGDARVAELQVEEFTKNGDSVTVFALEGDICPDGVELYTLGAPKNSFCQTVYRLLFFLDVVKVLKWLPRLKGFDRIICHLYPMTWLACLAGKFYGVDYTYWNHGIVEPGLYSHLHERLYLRISNLLTRITVRNVDRVVSISKFAEDQFNEYLGPATKAEYEIVYNKIDGERFHQGIDGTAVRGKYDLGNDPVMLYIGRISPHKGIHLLIEAFHLVRQQVPNARLLVVGKHTFGDYSRKLKEMANGVVAFAGYVDDEELPSYYAACNVYVTCSLWEGFNLPIAEAQSCGKPVVAFDIGAHKEVINEEGVLVGRADVAGFARECVDKILAQRGGL
jgi:glycosyltransferase involved in cell wall biosynthesis